ncbi:hypothetical protein SCE1572_11020 [Sorangium cellulosum So0157-2]|uniref:Uncharacterized protein n=1 Tax=Sorangium cellulosum So0157-2 TaxID=1254432 RepID=S4XR67_SORCE|nr:hypothetical protein SCE1572_11020 [Sorangium cellulosum So0157-2]
MDGNNAGGRSAASGAPGVEAQLAWVRRPAVARFWPARCARGRADLVRRAPPRPADGVCLAAPPRCGAARLAPAGLRAVFCPPAPAGPVAPRPRPAVAPAARFRVVAAFFAAALRGRVVWPAAVFLAALPARCFGPAFAPAEVLRAVPGRATAPAPALRDPFLAWVARRVGLAAFLAPPAAALVRLPDAFRPASPWDVAGEGCSRSPLPTRFLCLDVSFAVSPLGIEPSPELSRHELARGLMVPQPFLFPGRKVGGKDRNRNQDLL